MTKILATVAILVSLVSCGNSPKTCDQEISTQGAQVTYQCSDGSTQTVTYNSNKE